MGTAITASLGSHRYLDSRRPRLMCGPISDSHSSTFGKTQYCTTPAAPGLWDRSQYPIILFTWRHVFCLFYVGADAELISLYVRDTVPYCWEAMTKDDRAGEKWKNDFLG